MLVLLTAADGAKNASRSQLRRVIPIPDVRDNEFGHVVAGSLVTFYLCRMHRAFVDLVL